MKRKKAKRNLLERKKRANTQTKRRRRRLQRTRISQIQNPELLIYVWITKYNTTLSNRRTAIYP